MKERSNSSKSESILRSSLQIPLDYLAIASECPKKYEYWTTKDHGLSTTHLSEDLSLLKKIFKYAYAKKNKFGRRPAWKAITGVIDQNIFRDVDVKDDAQVDAAYAKSLKLIEKIRREWYIPVFQEEDFEGLIDWWDGIILPNGYVVTDTLDLILFDKEKDLILCQLSSIESKVSTLYNDIRLRGQALILSNELGRQVTRMRRISWGESDKIRVRDIHINEPETFHEKTLKALIHMTNGIKSGALYTSVSEQCYQCPFRKICSM